VRLGVAGNPIAHSLSPDIHYAFAKSLGIEITYERYLFAHEGFEHEAQALFEEGVQGLNVTVPFKQDAYKFADELDPLARAAGAVNTLVKRANGVCGYNTDGVGMVRDLQVRHNVELRGAAALILGAGGACRGIIQPLLNAGVKRIWVGNRTLERAHEVVAEFPLDHGGALAAVALDSLGSNPPEAGLVFNSTALGLDNSDIQLPTAIVAGRVCYDLSYGAQARFAQWAEVNGASRSLDGLGMLVEQAAESFDLWLGSRPDTNPIYGALKQKLT